MFRFITTLMFVLPAVFFQTLFGQTLTVKVSQTKVAVGEDIRLSYVITGNVSDFTQPNLSAFRVQSGPNQSSSFQNAYGNTSISTTIYYIITPKKEGTFTITGASATIDNKKVESEAVKIEAIEAPAQVQNNSKVNPYNNGNQQYNTNTIPHNNSNSGNTVAAVPAATTKDYFIRYQVDKTKAVIGEQIHLEVKLYTRSEVRGPDDFSFPTTEGFWKYDVPKTSSVKRTQENYDGVNYTVYVIFENFLFPQKAGEITIEPAVMKCRVLKPMEKTGNWWEDFMNEGNAREVPVTLSTQKISFNIEALPESATAQEFNGAVGEYTLKTEITRSRLRENEALNMRLTVSGRGNLKLIDAPKLELSENFESYQPKTEEDIKVNADGVSGSRTYDYTIVARNTCVDTIPAVNFTYFNDQSNEYVSLNTAGFSVTIDPADPNQTAAVVSNYAAQDSPNETSETIRDIKTMPLAVLPERPFFGTTLFYVLLGSCPVLFGAFLIWYNRKKKKETDITGTRNRMAGKIARQRLALAASYMQNSEHNPFYEELTKALYGYLEYKIGLLQSEFSQEGITNVFKGKNVSENTLKRLLSLVAAAEFARYAPATAAAGLQQTYDEAEACINDLEKELQKK